MNTNETLVPFLKTIPCFAGLDPNALETIAARCQSKAFRMGQPVFLEGDLCEHLYLLESGRVKFYRTSVEGREQTLKVFDRPGDTFCISSAFHTGRHIVSARAVTEARLRLLGMDTVNRLAEQYPSMALTLVAAAGEQMTHLVGLAEDLSLRTATARLSKHLYGLAVAGGAEDGKEVRLSRDRLPEEELASLLGTVRGHVSRSLMHLVGIGAITLTRGSIRIRDVKALKQIAEGK